MAQRLLRLSCSPVSNQLEAILHRLCDQLGVRVHVQLLESPMAQTPVVFGWLKPVILAPIGLLTSLSNAQVEALLAHELAHIRRHDYFINLLQTAAETILFYHPAIWWLSKRIRLEREHCCDDTAVSICRDHVTYASVLAKVEESRSAVPIGVAAGEKPLLSRIRRVLGVNHASRGKQPMLSAGLAVLLAVSIAVVVCCGDKNPTKDSMDDAAVHNESAPSVPEDKEDTDVATNQPPEGKATVQPPVAVVSDELKFLDLTEAKVTAEHAREDGGHPKLLVETSDTQHVFVFRGALLHHVDQLEIRSVERRGTQFQIRLKRSLYRGAVRAVRASRRPVVRVPVDRLSGGAYTVEFAEFQIVNCWK